MYVPVTGSPGRPRTVDLEEGGLMDRLTNVTLGNLYGLGLLKKTYVYNNCQSCILGLGYFLRFLTLSSLVPDGCAVRVQEVPSV